MVLLRPVVDVNASAMTPPLRCETRAVEDASESVALPGTPQLTSDARLEAAAALRALGHAFISHQGDEALLGAITATARQLTEQLEASEKRRDAMASARRAHLERRAAGEPMPRLIPGSLFPDSPISGRANPMGLDAHIDLEGEESVARVTLGPAFEGAPGRAHGGYVAAFIDETMGGLLVRVGTLAFTGQLDVTYRAPTPVGAEIECRAHLVRRDGRKLYIGATVTAAGVLCVEATALFITVDPRHLEE